jgi:mono/diheme cytochrome c family protein
MKAIVMIAEGSRSLAAKSLRHLCALLPTAGFLLAVALAAASAPKAAAPVSYEKEVKPLLVARCYACHGGGTRLGDFAVDSRQGVLTGGQVHPGVVPGSSAKSYLIKLVSGEVPGEVMPARGPRLTPAEVSLLRAWIDQGVSFGSAQTALWTPPLAPRRPKLPPAAIGSGLTNPIDRLLLPYFAAHKITPSAAVDDRTFARRLSLDTIGLLLPPGDVNAFVQDAHPNKRAHLAVHLLANSDAYAEHWLTFWNDMLRNDYTGTGYIDGGRTQITGWLYRALQTNMPYNQFATQLVDPMTPDSAGFANGIVWRGTVNASQTPAMQVSQNISQVFLGVNLKCASCHNSFVSSWKLADAYGMAGVYSDGPLETVRCDKPTGVTAPIKFLYPQLGRIDSQASKAQRMAQLAAALTCPADGRFARTFVNRLWAKLMGRGLVEPTDEMDNRPWDPDLLDWLASDFADHGYDVKRTIALIITSRAYQMPAAGQPSETVTDYRFTGPVVQRMTAEQFCDAVSMLTGVWPTPSFQPPGGVGKVIFQSLVLKNGTVPIDVDVTGARALSLVVTNGGAPGNSYDWADWGEPTLSGPHGDIPLTTLKWASATTGYGQVQIDQNVIEKPLRLGDKTFAHGLGTHADSVITYLLPPGITRFRAVAGPDTGGVETGHGVTTVAFSVKVGDRSLLATRASLAVADPLQRALGRPNREQVVTERLTAATTLQALELTNGATLNSLLETGAAHWTDPNAGPPTQRVTALYETALGRPPTALERKLALQEISASANKNGMEDLLWSLVMLPEFQLIY